MQQTNLKTAHKKTQHFPRLLYVLLAALGVGIVAACSSIPPGHGMNSFSGHDHGNTPVWDPLKPQKHQAPTSLNLRDMPDFDKVIFELVRKQVVFVGESHDRIEHHLNQLEIIKRIHAEHKKVAIGMEFFQQPFQIHLDEYIEGKIDEKEFLRKSEYFKRWRIDYRHYRPIIQYARQNGIPLLALDVKEEIQRKVGKEGINSLNEQEKKHLPDNIDRSNKQYRDMLQSIYNRHPRSDGQTFEKFIDVQLMRDEAMAQRTAEYMDRHPDTRMIVLAGGGHLVYGHGIPDRVARRLVDPDMAIVLNGFLSKPDKHMADFVLLPDPLKLPKAGRLGIFMDKSDNNHVIVSEFAEKSPASDAGAKLKDHIVGIDNHTIEDMSDVKYALLDKKPGDTVKLKLKRGSWVGDDKEINLEVKLN